MTQATQMKPKKPIKKGKLISNLICGVIAALMLIGAVVLFAGRAQNRVTFVGNKAMLWVMTPSMSPKIEAQSYVLIEKISAADVAVGDVITFYSDDPTILGKLNTHEVVEIQGEGSNREFVTKGSNSISKDAYTAKADKVVGRYVKSLPALTVLMRFFLTKAGLITVLLAVALLTLALCLPDILAHVKRKRAEETAELQAERDRRIAEEVERLKQQGTDIPEESPKNPHDISEE